MLSTRTYVVNKRYKQFKKLHRQLTHVAKVPLGEFPKKTVQCLNPDVIAYRTAALESYLRVAALEADLLPIVLEFLGVANSETPEIVITADSTSIPEKPNEGEMLVLTLESRLVREQDNKVSALDTFNAKFFREKRAVRREYVGSIVGKLVELCADKVCGSLALEIISKTISTSLSRSASEFKAALLRLPVATLSTMCLHQHLLGQFPGDSTEAAFTVLSLLHDSFKQTGLMRNWTMVLNGSEEASAAFTNWQEGTIVRQRMETGSENWRKLDSGDEGIVLEQRAAKGELELKVTILSIKASSQRIVDCISNPAFRRKWNTCFTNSRILESLSPEATVMELTVECRGIVTNYPVICSTVTFPNGDKEVTFYETDETRVRGQPIFIYWIEPCLKPSPYSNPGEDSTSSNESPDTPELQRLDSLSAECKLVCTAHLHGELKRKLMDDLANSVDAYVAMWRGFKAFVETEKTGRLRLNPIDTALHVACASKILSPRKLKKEG